jgi:hypothetical protein
MESIQMPIANRRKTTGSSKPKKMVPAKRKTTPKGKRSKASAKQKKLTHKAVRPQPFPVCGAALYLTGDSYVYGRW